MVIIKNGRYRGWACLVMVLLAFRTGTARERQDFFTAVKQDTVCIFLKENPRLGHGFTVSRKGPGEKDFTRLTEQPVLPVLNPVRAAEQWGADRAFILHSLEAKTAEEALLRLRTDRFTGGVYTMLFHPVGKTLGRFAAFGGHKPGATYRFRITVTDEHGAAVQTMEKKVTVTERIPAAPRQFTAVQEAQQVALSWKYPKWQDTGTDLTVQFRLYRRADGTDTFERIKRHILLRLDGLDFHYTDSDAVVGRTYTYYLTAMDAAGVESKPSPHAAVAFRDADPPAPPQGLIALAGDGSVELVWNMSPEPDAAGYRVYRWNNPEARDSLLLTVTALGHAEARFVDSTCRNAAQYYYAVSALDSAGNEGVRSNRISAMPSDRTPPPAVTGLAGAFQDGAVTLTWSGPSANGLRGYKIARGQTAFKTVWLTPEPQTATRFVHRPDKKSGLEPGRRYYYTVTAVDSAWLPGPATGTWVSVPDHEPPLPPGMVNPRNEYGRAVVVAWNASPSLDVAGYRVARQEGKTVVAVDTVPGDRRQLTDTAVVKGHAYMYRVTALDTAGNESPPAVSGTVAVKDFSGPPAPAFAAAVKEPKAVAVRWERVVDFDLAGYNVYRSDLATGTFVKVNRTPVTGTAFSDPRGKAGHWYRIRALDTSGNEGAASRAVAVRTGK